MKIIPAIDIIDGKAVRLTKGDYAQKKIYSDDPIELAKQFESAGLQRLHLVDLDGARLRKVQHIKLLEKICTATKLQVDFGGGVKTSEEVKMILEAGASMITIGSLAVKEPDIIGEWAVSYGADKFFIGADVLHKKIRINGWMEDGGLDIFSFIESMERKSLIHFFCTDIEKDGLLQGASINLYEELLTRFPAIQLTASGGVSSTEDLKQLRGIGCNSAIVGKAFYEGRISLDELADLNEYDRAENYIIRID